MLYGGDETKGAVALKSSDQEEWWFRAGVSVQNPSTEFSSYRDTLTVSALCFTFPVQRLVPCIPSHD